MFIYVSLIILVYKCLHMFITFILEQHHNLYYSNTNKKPAKIFHDIPSLRFLICFEMDILDETSGEHGGQQKYW